MKKSLLAALIATAFCISARVDAADAAAYIATVRGGPSDLTLSVSLFPDPALTGLQGNIYVAALIGDNWYFKTPAGWKRWESNTPRPVFVRATLNPQDLSIFNSERVAPDMPWPDSEVDLSAFVGAEIYVAYGTSEADMLDNRRVGLVYRTASGKLHTISRKRYDGVSNDLLTAGLGQTGIGSAISPATQAGFNANSAEDMRRLAIYNNYRGLIDASPAGGFGTLYGPNVANDGKSPQNSADGKIAGEEIIGIADPGDGSEMVSLMLQIPASFDKNNPCLLTATSSGSRGVYGAIGTVGDWGLKQGCAVVYNDKGSGTGAHALSSGVVTRADGLNTGTRASAFDAGALLPAAPHFVARDEAGLPVSPTHAFNAQTANRYAFKHAHSQNNPEAKWGGNVLDSVRYALGVLNEKFGTPGASGLPRAVFAPLGKANSSQTGVIVIASSVSNGGGAALRAAEADSEGLISGVAVSEPQVQPNPAGQSFSIQYGSSTLGPTQHSKTLYDLMTLYALYQPCASLANPTAASAATLNTAGAQSNRCKALAQNGLLGAVGSFDVADGAALAGAATAAQKVLNDYGLLSEQNAIAPSYEALRTHSAVAVSYANAYGKFAVTQNLCGYSFAASDAAGNPIALAAASDALLFGTGNGVPPTGGVNLINNLSPGGAKNDNVSLSPSTGVADLNFDGLLCLRKLATGKNPATGAALDGSDLLNYQRVQSGIDQVRAAGNLRGKPALIVHGRSDALIAVNHTSRAYFGLNQKVEGSGSRLSYVEVSNAHHLDVLNGFYPTATIPLHVYLVRALNAVYATLKSGVALPPSQVVHTSTRATAAETLVAAKLPPLSNTPGADAIIFSGSTVQIPQ